MGNVLFYLSFSPRFASFLEARARPILKRDKISFTVTDLPRDSNKNNHIAGEQSDVESFRATRFTYTYIYTVRFQT